MIDASGVAVFRIAFGALLLVEVGRYFANGWIQAVYVGPPFHFTYYGFEWVRPWPGAGMVWHFFGLGVLAALLMVGLWARWAALGLAVGWAYVFLLDEAEYLNHLYLICLLALLLALAPASRVWSLDGRRNPALPDQIPAWALWALRAQVAIPYFFGGISKLNSDWLHGQPLQLWMSRMEGFQEWIPGWGEHWLALVFSWGGLVLDLAIVPLLLWRRTRLPAFCLAVGFHVMNALMWRIGIFPWLMIAATTLFFGPDWPRRVGGQGTGDGGRQSAIRNPQSAILTLLAIFFAAQLLVPLRHWAYPGNVDWTEEGSHFSWRMMLADKAAALRITVVDPATGEITPFDPRQFLTPKQLDKLAVDPENLREFAAAIKADLVRRDEGHKEVRVLALCALNGRKPQPLVDPSIDLGEQPRTLLSKPWIRPLTEPRRDEAWLVPQSQWERDLRR
jgi:vitamin K-dependent gamma-carboxylase